MRWFRWACAPALAVVLSAGFAAPAIAHARPSVKTVAGHVRAADAELVTLARLAHTNPGAARAALARARVDAGAAARQARSLRGHAPAASSAWALSLVAAQDEQAAQTFTRLLSGSGGASLPPQLQALISQALSAATSALSTALAQLQAVLPSLPAPAQAEIQAVAAQLAAVLAQLQSQLSQATQTLDSVLGSQATGQLGQLLAMLQSFVSGLVPSTGSSGSGTGGSGLSSLPLPSFLQQLLGGLGLGGLSLP
jgi:hypothetical protein